MIKSRDQNYAKVRHQPVQQFDQLIEAQREQHGAKCEKYGNRVFHMHSIPAAGVSARSGTGEFDPAIAFEV